MKTNLIAVLCIAGLSLAGCSQADPMSGVYMQKRGNSLLMIQIVKTPDGKITGRGEAVSVDEDGSLKDDAFPLEGGADGAQLSLKSNVFLGLGQSFSGNLSGNTLHIVTDAGQADLSRSDLNGFTNAKSGLQGVARATLAANQRAKDDADEKTFLTSLANDGAKIDAGIPANFAVIEEASDRFIAGIQSQHDTIVNNVKKLKAKWFITPSDDKGSVEGDIQSQEGDMQSLQGDYEAKINDIRQGYDTVEAGLDRFKSNCQKGTTMSAAPVPAQCAKADTYLSLYAASRARLKAKYENAGVAMFPQKSQ